MIRQKKQKACFYCGHRTAQPLPVNVRQWDCESCEAQNYLDDNGDITDPPPLEYTAGKRFARSPELPGTDNTLFCRRCIQNQYLLTESLASYFPLPDAPDYPTYEENYPKFRESLEERYPQVCRDCAPKVEQRIRDTGYAAKTDHLRRLMDRTRRGQHGHSWDWKQLNVKLGLFAWFASLAGQILWHTMGALAITMEQDVLQDEDLAASAGSCFRKGLHLQHVNPGCARIYHQFAGLALATGALSAAWNPKLGEKLRRKDGRIVGLTEYYKLQVLLLVMKFVAWLVLGTDSSFYFEPQTMKAAHAIMIVLSILISVVSFRTVQIDYTPKFSFQENLKPLLPQETQHPTVNAISIPPQGLSSPFNASDPMISSFPISQLAPLGQQTRPSQYTPPTPPPEESAPEPMDWSPIHTPFRTPSMYQSRQQPQKPTQPSPFYVSLPPNAQSEAQRLRNPQEPIYRHGSYSKQKTSFKGTNTQISLRPNKSTALSSSLDIRTSPSPKVPSQSPLIAQPRFFAPSDRERATGLESLFSTTFTVKEEPSEVQRAQLAQHTESNDQPVSKVTNPTLITLLELSYHRRITGVLIILATMCWSAATSRPYLARILYLGSIGAASVVAGLNLFNVLQREREDWSLSDALVFSCELLMTIFVGRAVSFPASSYRTTGRWLLYLMLGQEAWLVWQEVCKRRDAHVAHLNRVREDALKQQRRASEGGHMAKIGRGDGMW